MIYNVDAKVLAPPCELLHFNCFANKYRSANYVDSLGLVRYSNFREIHLPGACSTSSLQKLPRLPGREQIIAETNPSSMVISVINKFLFSSLIFSLITLLFDFRSSLLRPG